MRFTTIDISGDIFGRLRVIGQAPKRTSETEWICQCECGATTIAAGSALRSGRTRSCGCLLHESKQTATLKHGAKAGGRQSREYNAWNHAKRRCFTPSTSSFRYYGGRGITMCERWANDFAAFLADMGECPDGHSLDRINNDGNYEPGNCRWATRLDQNNNRRKNVRYEFEGERRTIGQIARMASVNYASLFIRLRSGQSAVDAIAAIRWHCEHGNNRKVS
jgi:hypothetical protein